MVFALSEIFPSIYLGKFEFYRKVGGVLHILDPLVANIALALYKENDFFFLNHLKMSCIHCGTLLLNTSECIS
jgi:hypothetical protein